jgi:spermidine/putrescine ABC transporter ATP-binding subunit
VQTCDVELTGISKSYGRVAAVKSIDLSIGRGELISLLGPSGCGKTTTLRMIAGLEDPDAGQIRIGGQVVNDVPTYRRNIGMVFQNYALFPHMTVAENIAFGLLMRGQNRSAAQEKVRNIMKLMRLGGMGERLPSQLSGGQRQRVALARAIVTKPSVLLLDEPLGALDKKLREQMQVEIRILQREVGITTVVVTHDQEEALTLSDRIVVMEDGRIVQVGTPQEVYGSPATAFISDFIGVSNTIPGVVLGTEGNLATVQAVASGVVLRAPLGPKAGRKVEMAVRPENILLARPSSDGYNVLDGVVSHVVYTGPVTYFHVEADSGGKFIALMSNVISDRLADQPKVGQRIPIAWRYESTRLLPAN